MKEQIQFFLLKIYVRLGIISPKRMTTAQLSLAVLKRIPRDRWMINSYHNDNPKYPKACALGWMNNFFGRDNAGDDKGDGGNYPLSNLSVEFLKKKYLISEDITEVNDTKKVNNYIEDYPKDRVIHMLKDAIADGY